MQRYNIEIRNNFWNDPCLYKEESTDGEWVKYEEAESEIDALKKKLAIAERALEIIIRERRAIEIYGRDFMAEAAAEIEKEKKI